MTSGKQIRDFIHVQDVATKLLQQIDLLQSQVVPVTVTNIASGVPLSVREFALKIWNSYSPSSSLSFGSLPLRPGEMSRYVALVSSFLSLILYYYL